MSILAKSPCLQYSSFQVQLSWRFTATSSRAENEKVRKSVALAILAPVLLFTLPTVIVAFGEQSQHPKSDSHAAPPAEERVDINTANLQDLMKIPGLTRSWAARIIRFRPYHAKNDLVDRGVLPSQVYDRIKDYVIAHRIRQ
jgi:DNA uptake protein ComE-like DNA-binding protein